MTRRWSVLFLVVLLATLVPAAVPAESADPSPLDQAIMLDGPLDPTGDMVEAGGLLYLVARGDDGGSRLWRSDGTSEGTRPLEPCRTVLVCGQARRPRELYGSTDLLYFRTTEGLWRTDGTSTGTVLLAKDADVHGGRRGHVPRGAERDRLGDDVCDVLVHGTRAYLIASSDCYDPAYRQLWVTDGSRRGTRMLIRRFDADPNVLTASSAKAGRRLVFSGFTADGSETWVTDGTRHGTRVLKASSRWRPSYLAPVTIGGRFVFAADDGVHGAEPWMTDGTTRGTRMVRDIRPGRRDSNLWLGERWPSKPVPALGDGLLFVADDGVHGREPWLSDGTRKGTRLVRDIRPGPDAGIGKRTWPAGGVLSQVGDRAYLVADDGVHGPQLWTTDGTRAGTRAVTDLAGDEGVPVGLVGWEQGDADLLLVVIRSSADPDSDVRWIDRASLWTSDGTPAGTSELRQLGTVDDDCEQGRWSTADAFEELPLFIAPGGEAGCRLWRTDGTAAGTYTLDEGRVWQPPVTVDGEAYFIAYAGDSDAPTSTLWRTDGTRTGTVAVSRSGPEEMLAVENGLFFLAGDGSEGASSCWGSRSSCRLWFLPTGDDVPQQPPAASVTIAPSPSASPASGRLAARFPRSVDGQTVTVTEREGAAWIASFDPDDPDDAAAITAIKRFVGSLDRGIDDLSVASALLPLGGRPAAITAVRVAGADRSALIDAVIPFLFADTVEPARERMQFAGKPVIRVSDAAIRGTYPRYIRPAGDTVWLVEADARYLDEIMSALP